MTDRPELAERLLELSKLADTETERVVLEQLSQEAEDLMSGYTEAMAIIEQTKEQIAQIQKELSAVIEAAREV